MPAPVVWVTLKPRITIQLLFEATKPLLPPATVTLAPGAVVNVIGATDVPEFFTETFPPYVPLATTTVTPAVAMLAAALMVQNGVAPEPTPTPVSRQFALPRSTESTLEAEIVSATAALALALKLVVAA